MVKFAAWRGKIALAFAIVFFALGVSGCFQTVDASISATVTVEPTLTIPPPPPTDVPPPTAVPPTTDPNAQQPQQPSPAVTEAPPAVAQNPTVAGNAVFGGELQATQTAVQAILFAQATQILAGVTQTAAFEQTATATAQGTGGPPAATAAPTQQGGGPAPVLPTAIPGTPILQGTPGEAGSGAAGTLSANCVYTVVEGDRIFRIALRFGSDMNTLARANGLVNPDLISVDQKLRIPSCRVAVPTPGPGTKAAPDGPLTANGGGGRTYVVQEGDTLFSIATRYSSRVTSIAQANGIANVNLIFIGQNLVIP